MRLTRISLRGLLQFRSVVTVDLEQLGPGLVAITGVNGAGKTSFVEAVPAALYKALPSRESWYEYFSGRDAFVEAVFEDLGHEIKVRVQVDAERRSTERYVFIDGESATTGRAKEADAEILRRFGSYELFLVSVLGSQKRNGNFLDAGKGERKARFVELLGLERFQQLHEEAKAQAAVVNGDLQGVRNELGALEAQASLLSRLELEVGLARTNADAAAHKVEDARTEEASAVAALERAKTAGERLAGLEAALRTADRALGDARVGLAAAVAKEPAARQTAEQRRASLKAQDPDVLMDAALDRFTAAAKSIDARRADLEAKLHERPALEAARKRAEELAQEAVALEAADRAWERAAAEARGADAAVGAANRAVAAAETHLTAERNRLSAEARLLERVPCTANAPDADGRHLWINDPNVAGGIRDLAGTCPLLKAAQDAKERGPQLKVDQDLLDARTKAQETAAAANEAVEVALAATDAIRQAEIRAELPGLQRKAAQLPALEEARTQLQRLADELEAAKVDQSRSLKAVDDLRACLGLENLAIEEDLAKAIAAARDDVTEAQRRIDVATAAADAAKAALARGRGENDALSIPQAEASLSTARDARYAAERALRVQDQALAAANAKVDQLRERLAALPDLQAAARVHEQEVGDWNLLAQAFGRDGIQALEIDAAGPEVARLCNELLEACYGTRWTIAFETLREKKSERGAYTEAFDVRVFDHGQERTVEGISGGERVIVGEALALAIAIYNARKSGVQWRTLFRDETSGALSLANAQAYADMLRRALALGGFHQVVFISHQPEVVERADARLAVADGRVSIEGAPAPATAGAAA